MKLYRLLLAGVLSCATSFAATDPFVGTWVYNAQKSPKPTIRYAIKDLGNDRYALTGSTGTTVEIKADGVSIQSPPAMTVSFKKLDDHNWEMVRDEDGQKMVRTYNISPDDKTLTLHDVFTGETKDSYETTTKYARISPGNSIFGEWQSVSMEEKTIGEALKLIVTPAASDGLSISVPARKHLTEIKFDGKMRVDSGPGDLKSHTSSGKRVNDHFLQIENQIDGEPQYTEEWKLSEDAKTLTIITRMANSSAVFTMVWDKQ